MFKTVKSLSCVLILSAIFPGVGHARGPHYQCVVKNVSTVDSVGNIKSVDAKNKKDLLASYIGTKFSVDVETGKIVGSIVTNQSENAKSTTVLNRGGNGNFPRILTVFGPNPSILYFEAHDFGRGEGPTPFIAFRWNETLYGTCDGGVR